MQGAIANRAHHKRAHWSLAQKSSPGEGRMIGIVTGVPGRGQDTNTWDPADVAPQKINTGAGFR